MAFVRGRLSTTTAIHSRDPESCRVEQVGQVGEKPTVDRPVSSHGLATRAGRRFAGTVRPQPAERLFQVA